MSIFDNLGTSEKYIISFIEHRHMMIYNDEQVAVIKHFAVAFFGYCLQNYAEYKQYFSEEYVSQQEDLA
jgi:hypothetical protein